MNGGPTWRRTLVRYLPVVTASAGVVLVYLSSLVTDPLDALGVITLGLISLLASIWYAANPFLKTERRFFALRDEVSQFISLVRNLNQAALAGGSPDAVRQATAAMHASVDRMAEVAGKEGPAV